MAIAARRARPLRSGVVCRPSWLVVRGSWLNVRVSWFMCPRWVSGHMNMNASRVASRLLLLHLHLHLRLRLLLHLHPCLRSRVGSVWPACCIRPNGHSRFQGVNRARASQSKVRT